MARGDKTGTLIVTWTHLESIPIEGKALGHHVVVTPEQCNGDKEYNRVSWLL